MVTASIRNVSGVEAALCPVSVLGFVLTGVCQGDS